MPFEADGTDIAGAWPLAGTALLTHATQTLRSIMLLAPAGAHNDASRLLRSLYDHVVTFAWLAENPRDRLGPWRLEDLAERLKADREATAAEEPLLEAAAREQMQAEVDAATASTPDLASKAFAADRYWSARIPAIGEGELESFRGMYTFLFRNHSGLVHATFRGLSRVVEDLSPTRRRVVAQPPLDRHELYGMATVVHGLGLFVAAEALGWPAADEVHSVFDRHPST